MFFTFHNVSLCSFGVTALAYQLKWPWTGLADAEGRGKSRGTTEPQKTEPQTVIACHSRLANLLSD